MFGERMAAAFEAGRRPVGKNPSGDSLPQVADLADPDGDAVCVLEVKSHQHSGSEKQKVD